MEGTSKKNNNSKRNFSFFPRRFAIHEPEVLRTIISSVLFIVIFLLVDFYGIISENSNSIKDIVLNLIGGLLGLLGFSFAGMAVVISMFSSADITTIDRWDENAFSKILKTFESFAYDIVIEVIIFICLYLFLISSLPVPPKWIFYVVCTLVIYSFLFLLFYGWALFENFLSLSKIKSIIDELQANKQSLVEQYSEVAISQLVEILYRSSNVSSTSFYQTLYNAILQSNLPNKSDLANYISKKYLSA